MCVAMPGLVKEIKGNLAIVDYGGIVKEASLEFLEGVEVGDYVIVHVGYAISKLSKEEAEESLRVWKELLERLGDEA